MCFSGKHDINILHSKEKLKLLRVPIFIIGWIILTSVIPAPETFFQGLSLVVSLGHCGIGESQVNQIEGLWAVQYPE